MKTEITMKDRYIEILSISKLNKREFCKIINIRENVFNRFINTTQLSIKTAELIESIGFNPRWLLTGNGNIYINSVAGLHIKKILEKEALDEKSLKFYKFKMWIETHYVSMDNFIELFALNDNNMINLFETTSNIPYDLTVILRVEGFNLKWLYHDDEDPYLSSVSGLEKKRWVINNLDENNYIYKELAGVS